MQFKYIGDEKSITLRGVKFTKDAPVDLSKKSDLAAKASVLPYFEEHIEETQDDKDKA